MSMYLFINSYARRSLKFIRSIFSHKYAGAVVIVLFVVQAFWVAFSFRYPMIFDERYHYGMIEMFSHTYNPIVHDMGSQYDTYGNMQYSNVSIYHYLLSYCLRAIQLVTTNEKAVVLVLRVLNIVLAATGLLMTRRLLEKMGLKQHIVNLALLLYSLIPITVLVAATISYDNMLFPLTVIFLLCFLNVQLSKELRVGQLLTMASVGLFASLVKFTFLPMLLTVIFLVAIKAAHLKRSGHKLLHERIPPHKIIGIVLLIILSVLFTLRYAVPVVRYGTPIPECDMILSRERCMKSGNYKYMIHANETKGSRPTQSVQEYVGSWMQTITVQLDTSGAVVANDIPKFGKRIPVIATLMTVGVYLGVVALIYMWRSLPKMHGAGEVIMVCNSFVIVLFLFNIYSYYKYNLDINVQVRYLILLIPIYLALALTAVNKLLGRVAIVKLLTLCFVLALCTQGGGVIKHILSSDSNWYWDSSNIKKYNDDLRRGIAPLVKE